MVAHWTKSDAWQKRIARGIGLFWDYLQAKLQRQQWHELNARQQRNLLRGFSSTLLAGTLSHEADDPLGLYWPPQPTSAVRDAVSAIDRFALWVASEYEEPNAIQPVPAALATGGGEIVESILMSRRKGFSLLGHLDREIANRRSIVDLPKVGRSLNRYGDNPLSFPPTKVEALLWDGFRRPNGTGRSWDDFDVRAMMITLLQGYAGCREHEPYHLWITDIVQDPEREGHASVFLYHPSDGLAYIDDLNGKQQRANRRQKLLIDYRMTPRNEGVGSHNVGWKNSKVETHDNFAPLYWIDPVASALFWQLFVYYLERRETIMSRRRALGYGDHPFLFVSEREARNLSDGAKFIGAPWSIDSYEAALRQAVQLIGLHYGKRYGTTTHGLRHFYAYVLKRGGSPRKIVQEGLRQRNPFSQDIYGNPTPKDISDSINRAQGSSTTTPPSLTRTLAWLEERHPEYAQSPLYAAYRSFQ